MEILKEKSGRPYIIMGILAVSIILAFFISLNLGLVRIAPLNVIRTLIGQGTDKDELVLFDFRLPRMLLSILVGAGIGVSGAILQGVSQNDLADPGILGINTGAGFAVVLYIFLLQGIFSNLEYLSVFIMPIFALLGALLAAALIYLISSKNGVSPVRLVLVGIGINAAFGAAIIIFQLKMNPREFMQATVWLSGSLGGANWKYVMAILPWIVLLLPLTMYKARYLNVLNLGDFIATGLGANVEKERKILLFLSVALAGASVAVGGGIAFLGLVAPHLARRLVGPNHKVLIPATALMGAFVLIVSDAIGRNLLAPTEIPVGFVVCVLGAPYFIYLLMKTN